ncbi:hypothetical protein ES707_06537 [subsurface metagenome]
MMTTYRRGDVVLVSFIFSDETGIKQRPVVVISSEAYHQNRQEAIISAITSRTDRILTGDYLINSWKESGLKYPSIATGIIRTIKQSMIIRKLGAMSREDLRELDKQLNIILGLV